MKTSTISNHSTKTIRAILGPTNTGKTHLALERMLAYSSGIIGFPLRLLARENYEKMVSQKGEKYVALITGEEKIYPPEARWFACTVEAMPIDVSVDFIAIDEIQLCADPDRGHIFTDRLLHCRGQKETMFLGADTIKNLLRQLVPEIEIDTRPRLSALTYAGFNKLTKLPSRTAIVTFSATEVYAIAEFIRQRSGGCALIMGRLSPRTRNAQMALYQNKEVDYLVATDAIGMGLNMDVDHVAFAGLSKFDGHQFRHLSSAELAQIAGRAGRGMHDGTFGTTANCLSLDEKTVEAIENHHFNPITHLYWRNRALDFSTPSTLLNSLNRSSPIKTLTMGHAASDLQTLTTLMHDWEIMAACQNAHNTRLLWENCQIPDFRKLGIENHAAICRQIFFFLLKQGHIPENWFEQQIKNFAHPHGDIDTLMQRLASIRIYAYIANKNNWVPSAPYWQKQTREVEDSLSDALHTALMSRFVNKRATFLIRHLKEKEQKNILAAVTNNGEVVIEGQAIGTLKGFTLEINQDIPDQERALLYKASQRALKHQFYLQFQRLIKASDQEFSIDYKNATILWEMTPIGRLRKGHVPIHPEIGLIDNDFIDHSYRKAIYNRLKQFVQNYISQQLYSLWNAYQKEYDHPEIRGILHQLWENLGIVWNKRNFAIPFDRKKQLHKMNIIIGHHAIFFPDLLKPKPFALRAFLWSIFYKNPFPNFLPDSQYIIPLPDPLDAELFSKLGWLTAGKQMIRLDIAERVTTTLLKKTQHYSITFKNSLITPLHTTPANRVMLLKALLLNRRLQPAQILSKTQWGPTAPLMIYSIDQQKFLRSKKKNNKLNAKTNKKKPDQKNHKKPSYDPEHPFSELAVLITRFQHD